MSVTQVGAGEALHLIDEAGRRSAVLRFYQSASPHLLLWGGVCAAAYTFRYFRPQEAMISWAVIIPVATIGDALIARRDREGVHRGVFVSLVLTFFAFISATAMVMQPHDGRQMAAFVPLVVALCYVILGIFIGRRLMLTGIGLGVLTLIGFFAFPAIFMLWMAAIGGGALVLGGFWLRRV